MLRAVVATIETFDGVVRMSPVLEWTAGDRFDVIAYAEQIQIMRGFIMNTMKGPVTGMSIFCPRPGCKTANSAVKRNGIDGPRPS